MKTSGIYKIQSKVKPVRIYVGSAVNITNRWRSHINNLKNNKHQNKKLQNHFNKYGEADLQFIILLECKKEDLIANEQFFIDSINPSFNICKKAGSCLGTKQSKESNIKRKLSLLGQKNHNYGKRFSEETRRKLSISHRGKKRGPHSDETKRKIRLSNIGKHICSDEYRIKLSNSALNKLPMKEETKLKISKSHKGLNTWSFGNKNKLGKHLSEESKKRLSESHKGKKLSKVHKLKISESNKGRMVSELTRQKISQANKGNTNWKYRKQKKVA